MRIGLEQRAQGTSLMQIDDNVGERLDAAPLGTEDEDGLAVVNQPPGGCKAEFALVVGKEPSAATLGRDPVGRGSADKESLDPGPLVADAQIEPRGWRRPHYLTEPQPGRPPVILDQPSRMIAAEPSGEVIELVAVGQDCRETDDPALLSISTAQKPLNLHLVADLTFIEADHVPFVED